MTTVYVKAYVRDDGTHVKAHTREIEGATYKEKRQSTSDLSQAIINSIGDFTKSTKEEVEMYEELFKKTEKELGDYRIATINSKGNDMYHISSIRSDLDAIAKDLKTLKIIREKAGMNKEEPSIFGKPIQIASNETKGLLANEIPIEIRLAEGIDDLKFQEETGVKLNIDLIKKIPKEDKNEYKLMIRDAVSNFKKLKGRISELRIDDSKDDSQAYNLSDKDKKKDIISLRSIIDTSRLKADEVSGLKSEGSSDYKSHLDHEIAHSLAHVYKNEKNEFIDFVENNEREKTGYIAKNISGYAKQGYNEDLYQLKQPLKDKCLDKNYQYRYICESETKKLKEKNLDEIFTESYSKYMFLKRKGNYDAIQNNAVMKKMDEILEKMKNKKSFWNIF